MEFAGGGGVGGAIKGKLTNSSLKNELNDNSCVSTLTADAADKGLESPPR